jgi:hypothetical protein
MIVVVTPAGKHKAVEDLSFLAQDALDMTREVVAGEAPAPSFADMMAEAGFGETTRGAVPLGGGTEETGPVPMILQLEVRTRAAD